MDNIKIGAVTIGQAPRTDITDDIRPMLASILSLSSTGLLIHTHMKKLPKNLRQRRENLC